MPWSPSPVPPDDREGLVRNPWLESNNAPRGSTEGKRSFEQSPNDTPKVNGRPSHIRSHTTAGHPLVAPPLPDASERCDVFTRGASLDLHETRPSLRRVINASMPDATREDCTQEGRPKLKGAERWKDADAEVIVHEIRSTDSLAGVALKYNISVAALRTANKLWASDSIHLRQVLYIPVRAVTTGSSNAVSNGVGPSSGSPLPRNVPDFCTQLPSPMRNSASDVEEPNTTVTHAAAAHTIATSTNSTIKRVPLSALSFFPPPSTSALLPSSHPGSRSVHPTSPSPMGAKTSRAITGVGALQRGSPSTPFLFGTSGGSMNPTPTLALTSFFNGAKDEIISRLSFDSVRGSSDAGEDPEVEMDIVRPESVLGQRNGVKVRSVGSWQQDPPPIAESSWQEDSIVIGTPRNVKSKAVRTVQLQPSPRMEIPLVSAADKAANVTEQLEIIMDSG